MDNKEASSSDYIADQKERMIRWTRRSDTLVKLTTELSTLSGTPACIVISSPNPGAGGISSCSSGGGRVVWPNDDGVSLRPMINLYKSKKGLASPKKRSKNSASLGVRGKKYGKQNRQGSNGVLANVEQQEVLMLTSSSMDENYALAVVDTQVEEVRARIDDIRQGKRPDVDTADKGNGKVALMDTNTINLYDDESIMALIDFSCADNADKTTNSSDDQQELQDRIVNVTDQQQATTSITSNAASEDGNSYMNLLNSTDTELANWKAGWSGFF